MRKSSTETCPCGSGRPYIACCGPLHRGALPAPDAEALMRSRYSAYVMGDEAWLLATWHPSTRPETLDLAASDRPKWIGLQVKRHEQSDEDHALVEFVARYRIGGRAHRLHETSRFVREHGRWYYVDGRIADD